MKLNLKLGFIGGATNSTIGKIHYISSKLDDRWKLVSGYFSRDKNMRNEYDKWDEQILKIVKEHPALQFIWGNYRGEDFPKLPNLFSKDEKEICQF